MFNRKNNKESDTQKLIGLFSRIRTSLKGFLISDRDLHQVRSLQNNIDDMEKRLINNQKETEEISHEINKLRSELSCIDTSLKGLTTRINSNSSDIIALYQKLSCMESSITSLSEEQHTLKVALSLAARSIQEKLNR